MTNQELLAMYERAVRDASECAVLLNSSLPLSVEGRAFHQSRLEAANGKIAELRSELLDRMGKTK